MAPGLMDVGTRTSVVMGDELKHFVNDERIRLETQNEMTNFEFASDEKKLNRWLLW